jgi:plasmid stabilization system protein ParE
MSSYQFTPQAVEDLIEIWTYIAADNVDAANRVEAAIYEGCAFLAENPLAGRVRQDLTDLPLRFWLAQPYRNYWIVYDPQKKPLQVIRIVHAARNMPRLLGS